MESIRKIRQEIDREIRDINNNIRKSRQKLQYSREAHKFAKKILDDDNFMQGFNPLYGLMMLKAVLDEDRRLNEHLNFSSLTDKADKIADLAQKIDERFDIYAQAKAQGIEINPEFDKRFKENVYEAITSLDIVRDGSLKEKDSELKRAAEKLSEEIKSDISKRSEEGHHAADQEA